MSVQRIPGPPPPRWYQRPAALRSRDLRLVWLAQGVSQAGDGLFTVGIVWLMVDRTGSGLALSGTLIAQLLPYALLGAAAGALADRWNRRLTMVAADLARALIVALLPIADTLGVLHLWMAPAVAFLLTSAGQFFDPAKNALVPAITPERDLVRVNALLSGTRQVMFIIGPSLGGWLIAGAGTMVVFWVDAASFALSAAVLSRMRTSGRAADMPAGIPRGQEHDAGLWAEVRAGFRYVRRQPVLRLILLYGTLDNVLLSPLPIIIPLFFVGTLGLGSAAFGATLSVIFAGFLLGVALMGVLGARLPLGWTVFGAMVMAGAAVMLFGTGPPLPAIFVLAFFGGAAIATLEVAETTIIQRHTADEVRGRVFALYESVSQGGRALAVALAGGLSEVLGLRLLFYTTGALTLAVALALIAGPTVRRLR